MANEKMDLIDRNELLPNNVFYVCNENPMASVDELLNRISNAKTVDAVPVVRCKDCKHFYHSVSSHRDGKCVQFGTYDTDQSVYLSDFCSYGERRNDG